MELIEILLGPLLIVIGAFFILAGPLIEVYHRFLYLIKRNEEQKFTAPGKPLLHQPKKATKRREKINAMTPPH